jgi:hypothetical protein
MSRRFVLAMLGSLASAAMLLIGASGGPWETAHAITNCTVSSEALDGDETSVAMQINQVRAANGLAPLLISPNLTRAAAWKSADSSNFPPNFDHIDSLGRGAFTRAMDCGYPTGAGENIAWGYSAGNVVNGWMGSDGHRRNLLNASAKVMGIGHTGNSWVWMYGTVIDAGAFEVGSPAPPPPTQAPPTSTPTQPAGGSNPPPGGGTQPTSSPTPPSATATTGGSSADGAPPPPAGSSGSGATPKPAELQPTNTTLRRATVLMLSFE